MCHRLSLNWFFRHKVRCELYNVCCISDSCSFYLLIKSSAHFFFRSNKDALTWAVKSLKYAILPVHLQVRKKALRKWRILMGRKTTELCHTDIMICLTLCQGWQSDQTRIGYLTISVQLNTNNHKHSAAVETRWNTLYPCYNSLSRHSVEYTVQFYGA
jgi:hypothetical protein